MGTPQIVICTAVVVLVILLFTSPRHRVPVYSASNEQTVQGLVQDVPNFYRPHCDSGRRDHGLSGTKRKSNVGGIDRSHNEGGSI